VLWQCYCHDVQYVRFLLAAFVSQFFEYTTMINKCESNLTKKAASPPHMNGLVAFARRRQC